MGLLHHPLLLLQCPTTIVLDTLMKIPTLHPCIAQVMDIRGIPRHLLYHHPQGLMSILATMITTAIHLAIPHRHLRHNMVHHHLDAMAKVRLKHVVHHQETDNLQHLPLQLILSGLEVVLVKRAGELQIC
jgi:hypothetical protein